MELFLHNLFVLGCAIVPVIPLLLYLILEERRKK